MKKYSILRKLWVKNFIIIFMMVILLMTVFIVKWQHTVIEYAFEHQKESIIKNQTDISEILVQVVIAEKLSRGLDVLSDEELKDTVKSVFYNRKNKMQLFREDELISGNFSEEKVDSRLLEQKLSKNQCVLIYSQMSGRHYIKAVSDVILQGQEYRVITTTDISPLYKYEKNILKQAGIIGIPFAIVIAVFFLILFFFLVGPLSKVNEAAKSVAAGNYNRKLKVKRSDEIGQLADSINKITKSADENIKSLKEIVNQQKSFVEDFSNEMSSPLTSILCYSEIILRAEQLSKERLIDYTEIILSGGRQLKKLSEKLTDFLYIGKINEYDKTEISVKETIDDICDAMTPMFQKKGVYFTKKIHDFIMHVDRELFQTMLYNYLDDAVSVSKEDDIVEINVYQTDMENIIEISDQSSTVTEQTEDKETNCSESVRSRLGMTLGQKIAAAHNGEVIVFNKLHKGTTVRIIFQQNNEIQV
ncbi:MAG: HAMP domain-containing histidine kinase [Lachnospiraceae bacterium]|nr:HAMP domain-containing histidine kinase [Lachnospiraceae bacterium]